MSQSDHRDSVRVCRDEVRKAKTHLELNLGKDVKGSKKKGFYRCTSNKRKTHRNVGLLLNRVGNLVTKDAEQALTVCFALVFSDECCLQEPRSNGPEGKSGTRKTYSG